MQLPTYSYLLIPTYYQFLQDKRLKTKGPQGMLAQRVAEALAFADTNFDGNGDDQEVFGICVRHRYFTFWHGYFPKAYLECIRKSPHKLKVLFYICPKIAYIYNIYYIVLISSLGL